MTKSSVIRTCAMLGAGMAAAAVVRRRSARFDFKGRVVLITGASRGLGLALARAFAAHGARLAICARDDSKLRTAEADLRQYGQVFSRPCDVSSASQVQSLIDATMAHYGAIDVLVNNAGAIQVGPLQTLTLADFETAMQIMYWGTVHTTLAALPHMLARGQGRIVNITSIGGRVSVPHLLPYSCAKFAAVAFSEGLRAELSGTGVKTVTIIPGLMRTGSFLNARFKGNDDREAAWFSLSASLPGPSIGVQEAVDQIVCATRNGTAEKIVGTPAKLLALVHALFPGATANALGIVNRLLPRGQGVGSRVMKPYIRRQHWLDSATAVGQREAEMYLQESINRQFQPV